MVKPFKRQQVEPPGEAETNILCCRPMKRSSHHCALSPKAYLAQVNSFMVQIAKCFERFLALGCIILIWKTFYKLCLNKKGGWGLKVYIISRWIKLRYKIRIRLYSTDFAPKEVDCFRRSFQGRLLIRTSRIVALWL